MQKYSDERHGRHCDPSVIHQLISQASVSLWGREQWLEGRLWKSSCTCNMLGCDTWSGAWDSAFIIGHADIAVQGLHLSGKTMDWVRGLWDSAHLKGQYSVEDPLHHHPENPSAWLPFSKVSVST